MHATRNRPPLAVVVAGLGVVLIVFSAAVMAQSQPARESSTPDSGPATALPASESNETGSRGETVLGATAAALLPSVKIYAAEDWYRARSEPEQAWQGLLVERSEAVGPNTRPSLLFALVMDSGELPIYAANVADRLGPYVGRRVVADGKRVDPGGFGPELWIGAIRAADMAGP